MPRVVAGYRPQPARGPAGQAEDERVLADHLAARRGQVEAEPGGEADHHAAHRTTPQGEGAHEDEDEVGHAAPWQEQPVQDADLDDDCEGQRRRDEPGGAHHWPHHWPAVGVGAELGRALGRAVTVTVTVGPGCGSGGTPANRGFWAGGVITMPTTDSDV